MRYQIYRNTSVTTTTAPFIEGDDPITTTRPVRIKGEIVTARDRAAAMAEGQNLYGRDFTGVTALDVSCQACEDGNAPVGNAGLWIGQDGPRYLPCPRCGVAP